MLALPTYAEERLALLKRLRVEADGQALTEFFRPEASTLRFRLGTSLADLRIPWMLGPALADLANTAVVDASLLVAGRHRPWLPASDWDRIVTLDGYDASALRKFTLAAPANVTREAVRRAFSDAPEQHTLLDAGLVASFLGTGRPGRTFAAALHAVFAKAREESSATGEQTPYLVALALRTLADRQSALLREAPLSEPAARFVRAGSMVLVSQAMQLALRESGLARDAGFSALPQNATPPPGQSPLRRPHEVRSALLALAASGVSQFAGVRTSIAQTGVGAWGPVFDAPPPRLEELVHRLQAGADVDELVRETLQLLPKERDALRRLDRSVATMVLRRELRLVARAYEGTRATPLAVPGEGSLERLLCARDGVEKLFQAEPRRKEFQQKARDAARAAPTPDAAARLEMLSHAARDWRDEDPAAWMGLSDARLLGARALVAVATDLMLERLSHQASQSLLERSGHETEAGAAAEYAAGHLYYVTHEQMPLLREADEQPPVGHLFCDMKDFTRRTAFLKESVIADFLQREFYGPILRAASGHDPGNRRAGSERTIQLNNLLGDAATFSGDIVALVALAKEIRTALADYARRLDEEGSAETVAHRMSELEKRHVQRREALERSIRELTGRLQGADPARVAVLTQRLKELKNELVRQNALFEAESARAKGEKLEAGSFLSYGAAPVVARFDDPVFGAQRVAIAEKINESARGTARNAGVKARADAVCARASRAAGRELVLPFAVFVDSVPSFGLTPEESLRLRDALSTGDAATAEKVLAAAGRRVLASPPPATGELYNSGIALSEEALEAYLDARADELSHARRELDATELAKPLQEKFCFPNARFEVVALWSTSTGRLEDLFVGHGRVHFKGFEAAGGLGVYELCDDRAPFFHLFAQHQLPALRRG